MTRELKQRVFRTIVLLLAIRVLHHIPLPGVWFGAIPAQSALGWPMLSRYSVASLGLTPYLSASIIVVLFLSFRLWRRGADDRDFRVEFYTLWLTGVIAVVQGLGLSIGMEHFERIGVAIVPNPGWWFRLSTTLPLTASTYVMVFLAHQISQRGIGNGVCLFVLVDLIDASSPAVIAQFTSATNVSAEPFIQFLASLALLTVVLLAPIALTLACWHVPLPQDHEGNATQSPVSLRFNTVGTVGLLLAQNVLSVVLSFLALFPANTLGKPFSTIIRYGSVGYWLSYCILAMAATTLWTAWAYDPRRIQILLENSSHTRANNQLAFDQGQFDRKLAVVTLVFATAVTLTGLLTDWLAFTFSLRGLEAYSLFVVVAISLDFARQFKVHQQMASAAMGSDKEMSCENCQAGINNDDTFCLFCGIVYEERALCESHPEAEALAHCIVCHKRLCKACSVDSGGRYLCKKHSEVTLIEGWATVRTPTTRLEAARQEDRLKNIGIPAFVLSNTIEPQYGTLGLYEVNPVLPFLMYREIGGGRIRVMVPAHEFIRTQELVH